MATNIEQAIAALLDASQPLTLSNVLRAYLRTADLTPLEDTSELVVTHDSLIAFEHALDKEPVFAVRRRPFTKEIAQLRKAYWEERLGAGAESANRCTCPSCGKTVRTTKEPGEVEAEQGDAGEEKPSGGRRRKATTKKAAKQHGGLSGSSPSYDPYGPSTSAYLL